MWGYSSQNRYIFPQISLEKKYNNGNLVKKILFTDRKNGN